VALWVGGGRAGRRDRTRGRSFKGRPSRPSRAVWRRGGGSTALATALTAGCGWRFAGRGGVAGPTARETRVVVGSGRTRRRRRRRVGRERGGKEPTTRRRKPHFFP
jgi:hypothetical protein